ncbi:hypothetical protein C5C63_07125 [Rathayibacter sp. AY1B8]|nr:hypothetical protein C5C63_07125 [Rathayibacter sp. AY1B8]
MSLSLSRPPTPSRRVRALAVGAALALAAALLPAQAAAAATPATLSVLSLGDSITQAYGTCGSFADCPRNNWSTGTSSSVNSFASRLRTALPGTTVTTANFATTGDVVAQVPSRIDAAVAAGVRPDVVTLLIGGNDLCSPDNRVASDGYTMTPASTFRTGASAAITKIRTTWPSARIDAERGLRVVGRQDRSRRARLGGRRPLPDHARRQLHRPQAQQHRRGRLRRCREDADDAVQHRAADGVQRRRSALRLGRRSAHRDPRHQGPDRDHRLLPPERRGSGEDRLDPVDGVELLEVAASGAAAHASSGRSPSRRRRCSSASRA